MATKKESAQDDLGRSFSTMFNIARGVPELIEFWRVVEDALPGFGLEENPNDTGPTQKGAIPNDPVALTVRANAMLFNHGIRYWLDWQKLLTQHLPRIRSRLEALSGKADNDVELKAALIDDLRTYLREMAELPVRHGRTLQCDIESLEGEILLTAKQEIYRRNHKYKN